MLKNPYSPRLLKKTQMQGGITHPSDGYPGPSEAYFRYAAASAEANQRRRWAFFSSLSERLAAGVREAESVRRPPAVSPLSA
jgi:hypothetical protein